MNKTLRTFTGKKIVVDTDSMVLYIGTLESVQDRSITLTNADVHFISDSKSTKEKYILESSVTGLMPNRKRVFINLNRILSFSPVEDIICYE